MSTIGIDIHTLMQNIKYIVFFVTYIRHDTQKGRASDLETNKTMRQNKFIEYLLEYSVKGLDTSYKGGP